MSSIFVHISALVNALAAFGGTREKVAQNGILAVVNLTENNIDMKRMLGEAGVATGE